MTRVDEQPVEEVVLLDETGTRIGTEDKRVVHSAHTPLHLAFSCYVFDGEGRLLVTRRALDKATFPGVVTNTLCGHPAPGEPLLDAVSRRAGEELGIRLGAVRVVLPRFRYRATMANGTTENEMCPVTTAVTLDQPTVDPAEVDETTWLPWVDFRDDVLAGRLQVSHWCGEQVRQLALFGDDTRGWPTGAWSDLPPAAR